MEDILKIVVPAFSGVGLLLLGAWLNSGREHKKWLRDKRFDAYLRFRAVVDMQAKQEGQQFRADPTGFAPVLSREAALASGVELSSAAHEIMLLGPKKVQDAAHHVMISHLVAATDRRDGGKIQEEAAMRLQMALADFIRAAQVELKIKP